MIIFIIIIYNKLHMKDNSIKNVPPKKAGHSVYYLLEFVDYDFAIASSTSSLLPTRKFLNCFIPVPAGIK